MWLDGVRGLQHEGMGGLLQCQSHEPASVGRPLDAAAAAAHRSVVVQDCDAAAHSNLADTGVAMKELTQTQPAVSQPLQQELGEDVHATLAPLSGGGKKYELKMEMKEASIGRHPDCLVRLDNKQVSSKHVRIYWDAGGHYYMQAISANPSYLDTVPMKKGDVRQLQHGNIISLLNPWAPNQTIDGNGKSPLAFVFHVAACRDEIVPGLKSDADAEMTTSASTGKGEAQTASALNNNHIVTEQWVREHWDIKVVLGAGNFSQVRLGVKVKTGEKFAVKAIEKKKFYQFQSKRETKLSLTSEAEVLTALRHPYIVQISEWFETDRYLFLVMECMQAGDLLKCIMEGGCFPEQQARRAFLQLCLAVKYLHKKDIVHRDLKPENILLTTQDREKMCLKVTDFGLARTGAHHSKDCRTFCGTPHYFAPEVISTFRDREGNGDKEDGGYGKPADMWSLGVILYVLLSGSPPFDEENLYEQILAGKYEFDVPEWNSVSPEAKDLVRGLMTVNPKDRLTIEQTLGHKWFLEHDGNPSAMVEDDLEEDVIMESSLKKRRTS